MKQNLKKKKPKLLKKNLFSNLIYFLWNPTYIEWGFLFIKSIYKDMKIVITESQLRYLKEMGRKRKSLLSQQERFAIVAKNVIEFMDNYGLNAIPQYRFLAGLKKIKFEGIGTKFFMEKYLNEGEYNNLVWPIIKQMRPEFTYPTDSKLGSNRFNVDTNVNVKSLGEVITYNTFKMNGIILKYEDPKHFFYFIKELNGVREIAEKKPDFFWEKTGMAIEVAGLKDMESFGKDYTYNLEKSQEEFHKTGSEMVILDYYTYKDNHEGFYKYVCETFNFPYNPEDFWTAIKYEGVDKEKVLQKVQDLITKGAEKTPGDYYNLSRWVKTILTQPEDPENPMAKPIGYKDVKHFKRETGIGLKFGDVKLRNMAQIAWCLSSGSNVQTYQKFKELFGDKHTLSKNTIENMKSKFPEEFDMSKRTEICGKLS